MRLPRAWWRVNVLLSHRADLTEPSVAPEADEGREGAVVMTGEEHEDECAGEEEYDDCCDRFAARETSVVLRTG